MNIDFIILNERLAALSTRRDDRVQSYLSFDEGADM